MGSAILFDGDRSVIIDMIVMDIVQAAIMDVIIVIAVSDHEMGIAFAMHVISMQGSVQRRFSIRVFCSHFQCVFVDMPVMDEVKVAVVEIVPMVHVPDFCVPTILAMNVRMVLMNLGGVFGRRHSASCDGRKSGAQYYEVAHE